MQTTVPAVEDFHKWALETAQAIRQERFDCIDWQRVAEELHSLGLSEESQLESRLTQLIYHLLKMEYQADRHSRSWELTVRDQRSRIMKLLAKQPSLKAYLRRPDTLENSYLDVRVEAMKDRVPAEIVEQFPETCPYSIETLLPELG